MARTRRSVCSGLALCVAASSGCVSAQHADPPEVSAVGRVLHGVSLRSEPDEGVDALDAGLDVPTDSLDAASDAGTDAAIPPDVVIPPDVPVPPDVPMLPDVVTPIDAVPPFDSATDAHVRALVAAGLARGNHREVFAKIGDSISESQSFLYDCGFGYYSLGAYADLEPTITYFRATTFSGVNSFNRPSIAAVGGWACSDALSGAPNCAVAQELDAIDPLWAIVMYGTNDMQRYDLPTFISNYGMVLDIIEGRSVVAVVSTIPSRSDMEPYISEVAPFNDAIRSIAASRHLPLIDYNAALASLPNQGVSPDGIHPDSYVNPSDGTDDACYFIPAALQFGYNMRNLTAIEMLARLRTY